MPFDVISYVLARRALQRLEQHRQASPIDHPDGSVTQSKLEYRTEGVLLTYLEVLGKTITGRTGDQYVVSSALVTSDPLVDKAVALAASYEAHIVARYSAYDSHYGGSLDTNRATQDVLIVKYSSAGRAIIASEAVDISPLDYLYLKLSVSGASLTMYRTGANPGADILAASYAVSCQATDTDYASGGFGAAMIPREIANNAGVAYYAQMDPHSVWLLAPSSQAPRARLVVDAAVAGSGKPGDPWRPDMPRDLVEVDPATLPEELRRAVEANPRGPNGQPLIDRAAVTWGIFEPRPDKEATILVTIAGDNPYQGGAVDRVAEYARSKGYRVLKPPRDISEARQQWIELSRDHPEWLAGKDNYAYQTIGHEAFEAFQAADFYYGNLVEHRRHYRELKRVPDWELRRVLAMWRRRLERIDVLKDRRDKHLKKLVEVERVGW